LPLEYARHLASTLIRIRCVEAIMQTHVMFPEAGNAMAKDCVEGTPVRGAAGSVIGAIKRVMVDKTSGKVNYAVLSFNASAQIGCKHLTIPWRGLTYDRISATYSLDLAEHELIALSRTCAMEQCDRGPIGERSNDAVEAYWGIAETW
jgi:PRC-barrel domain